MTAKEMAHWERWHRRGRRKFQFTIALIWFSVFGPGQWLVSQAIGSERGLFGLLGTALLLSVVFYISMGYQWDHWTAEYLKQRQSETSGSVQA